MQIKTMRYPFHTFRMAWLEWWITMMVRMQEVKTVFWKTIWQNVGKLWIQWSLSITELREILALVHEERPKDIHPGIICVRGSWKQPGVHAREWLSAGCTRWNDKQHWEALNYMHWYYCVRYFFINSVEWKKSTCRSITIHIDLNLHRQNTFCNGWKYIQNSLPCILINPDPSSYCSLFLYPNLFFFMAP